MHLNPQQTAAAEFDGGHVLVLAGAGTGKTRTIIARATHLIHRGVAPRRILLLTFTRRAAREMVQRLQLTVGESAALIPAGTFHHFCLLSMRRNPKAFDTESATVIDRDDQIQLMRLVRGEYKKKGEPFPTAAELVKICSFARNTTQKLEDYLHNFSDYDALTSEKICQVGQAYDHRKKQNNYLDYDDILFRFAHRLHQDEAVRERLRGFYDHILVDEMQDTNPLQWLILEGLRDPARLFCVGDDAQSIYAFRGADFRNVHSFDQRVPDATTLRLEENYRSTQGILDLANWLLAASPLKYGTRLTAARKAHSTPRVYNFDSDFDEARWITTDIARRHDTGAAWKEHMIITRSGYAARAVESFLVEKKIPYRFVGGIGLLQAAHVKDLFSLVRSAANHHDELAWARYLTLWPRIGDATAARIIAGLRPLSTWSQALEYVRGAIKGRPEIVDGFKVVQDNWQDPAEAIGKAGAFLKPIIEKRYENWKLRIKDFDLLARLAERFRSLMSFLETYTLDPIHTSEAQRTDTDDLVILSTAHSAKGTETPVCYLIRVEPGMYPHVRSLGSSDQEEEERRVLYVAMTRARDELIVTRTLRSGAYFRLPQGCSYFLEDLDHSLVETEFVDFCGDDDSPETITPWKRQ